MIDEQFCVHCARKQSKIFSHMRKIKRIYINSLGKEWHGSRCPDCSTGYKKNDDAARRRKKGHIPLGTICVCEKCNNQFELKQGCDAKKCSTC